MPVFLAASLINRLAGGLEPTQRTALLSLPKDFKNSSAVFRLAKVLPRSNTSILFLVPKINSLILGRPGVFEYSKCGAGLKRLPISVFSVISIIHRVYMKSVAKARRI